jgi:hypothetical protein
MNSVNPVDFSHDGKNRQKSQQGGRSKRGIRSEDIQAECNKYFKQGEFNVSYISRITGHHRESISKYKRFYLTEIKDTTDFITREQNARDELVLFLENYVIENNAHIKKLDKMLPKAGKITGIVIGVIANIRKDTKECVKEIAGLKMIPLTGDKIEEIIRKRYDLLDNLEKD